MNGCWGKGCIWTLWDQIYQQILNEIPFMRLIYCIPQIVFEIKCWQDRCSCLSFLKYNNGSVILVILFPSHSYVSFLRHVFLLVHDRYKLSQDTIKDRQVLLVEDGVANLFKQALLKNHPPWAVVSTTSCSWWWLRSVFFQQSPTISRVGKTLSWVSQSPGILRMRWNKLMRK